MFNNIPVYNEEGLENTTYGGIGYALGLYFNSTLDVTGTWGDGGYTLDGQLASWLAPDWSAGTGDYFCNITFTDGLANVGFFQAFGEPNNTAFDMIGGDPFTEWTATQMQSIDLEEVILGRVRQAMFLASVYEGS